MSAHRYILVSRSKWFRALLGHQWKETTTTTTGNNEDNNNNNSSSDSSNTDNHDRPGKDDSENQSTTSTPIPIQDISAKLFGLLLEFIYLDDLALPQRSEDILPELLISADRFSLIRLKVMLCSPSYHISQR